MAAKSVKLIEGKSMFSEALEAQYPSLTRALARMRGGRDQDEASSAQREEDLVQQLQAVANSPLTLNEVADALLAGVEDPPRELARISQSAYRHLGVSEDVRVFMGRLWAAAMRSWTGARRTVFLLLTVQDKHEIFEALDFTAELFKQTQFSAETWLSWLKGARVQVGNDLMQRGLWSSVEAMCTSSPRQAVGLAGTWLDEVPDEQALSTVATIIGIIREQAHDGGEISGELSALEKRLISGSQAWRGAYIQSWARTASRGLLTRDKANEIFDDLVTAGGAEEVAWCYLLHVLTERASASDDWFWLKDQLRRMARSGLSQASQYWLVSAILNGLGKARSPIAAVPAPEWMDLLRALCPIRADRQGTWSHVTHSLVDFAKTAPDLMRNLAVTLATYSGSEWLECDDRSDFRWFLAELAKQNQHTALASRLCFERGTFCRRLGMLVFAGSKVPALDPTVVRSARPADVELLLLEAQRYHIEFAALARLHAALTERVDEIGGALQELLYEEVARQCRNTYAYRNALRLSAPHNEYLLAIADDSETRIKETREPLASPALQMDVPGYARARRLHDRHMASLVAKGVAEKSVLLSLVRKVRLIYGGNNWRFFRPDGTLSESSSFHSSSAEVEMPQLEIANPEEAQMRRLQASARISRLEQEGSSAVK